MVVAIFILAISIGAIVAGRGYTKTARRMRWYETARGTVIAREVAPIPGGSREGRWGQGGGSMPKVTYTYEAGGTAYTNDRMSYAYRGVKHSLAEQQLAKIPDEVDVYYDPQNPQESYLEKHSPRLGQMVIAGGIVGVLASLIEILGSV